MNKQSRKSFLERSQTIIYLLEDSILVGLLLVMIVMSVLQIFLRSEGALSGVKSWCVCLCCGLAL